MSSIEAAPHIAVLERAPARFWRQGTVAVVAWIGVALLIAYFPNATRNWPMTQGLANLCLAIAALIGLAGTWVAGLPLCSAAPIPQVPG